MDYELTDATHGHLSRMVALAKVKYQQALEALELPVPNEKRRQISLKYLEEATLLFDDILSYLPCGHDRTQANTAMQMLLQQIGLLRA